MPGGTSSHRTNLTLILGAFWATLVVALMIRAWQAPHNDAQFMAMETKSCMTCALLDMTYAER